MCIRKDKNCDVSFLSHIAPIGMVRENSHLAWDRYLLSSNPQLQVRDILSPMMTNSVGVWDYCRISEHIDPIEVIMYPHLPWCKEHLSQNKRVCIKVVDTPLIHAIGEWRWYNLSENVPINDVINHPDRTWDRGGLSHNKGLTLHIWMSNIRLPNATGEWKISSIATHIIDMDEILSHPSIVWDKFALSYNPHLTGKVITSSILATRSYNWAAISRRVSMEDVKAYPHLPWKRSSLSSNPRITIEVVRMDLPNATDTWIWDAISMVIDINEVKKYPNEKGWDKYALSHNPSATINIRNLDLPNATGDWDHIYLDIRTMILLWEKKRSTFMTLDRMNRGEKKESGGGILSSFTDITIHTHLYTIHTPLS